MTLHVCFVQMFYLLLSASSAPALRFAELCSCGWKPLEFGAGWEYPRKKKKTTQKRELGTTIKTSWTGRTFTKWEHCNALRGSSQAKNDRILCASKKKIASYRAFWTGERAAGRVTRKVGKESGGGEGRKMWICTMLHFSNTITLRHAHTQQPCWAAGNISYLCLHVTGNILLTFLKSSLKR